jgi:hypothetical protein
MSAISQDRNSVTQSTYKRRNNTNMKLSRPRGNSTGMYSSNQHNATAKIRKSEKDARSTKRPNPASLDSLLGLIRLTTYEYDLLDMLLAESQTATQTTIENIPHDLNRVGTEEVDPQVENTMEIPAFKENEPPAPPGMLEEIINLDQSLTFWNELSMNIRPPQ